jgi:esterase/lipase superfamily enzyme
MDIRRPNLRRVLVLLPLFLGCLQVALAEKPSRFDPRATRFIHKSSVLGLQKSFFAYVPALPAGQRCGALYLFRGHEREWVNPAEDATTGGRTVIDVLEALIKAKACGPLILIFPGMSSADNDVSSLLVNMRAPQRKPAPGIGTGRFETYFLTELIPFVEANLPVLPGRRSVDGFSLGGFMSARIAAKFPELFRSAGAYDGTFFYRQGKPDKTLDQAIFDPDFGSPRDRAFIARNNAADLILRWKAPPPLEWFIEYGPEAAEPNDSNFYRGEELVKILQSRGVRNAGGVVAGGHHDWKTALGHMERTLPRHYQALTRP